MFTNAKEIIDIIEHRKNRGYGLSHFQEYMESLGNPHKKLKCVHIAGTNGKGSTTNYIRSILEAAGYKVGTFTSPYMITHLDRIRINDVYIPEHDFVEISNQYYADWMKWDLSMFEIDMCIAVTYFNQCKVDFALFEVGLGGRLDSTNILKPMVSVITNIGLDHMDLLGDTYEKIAGEKAGIIKDGIDLITGEDKEECLRVFEQHCAVAHSQCIRTGIISDIQIDPMVSFTYKGYEGIQLSTMAAYQSKNASLAMEVIMYLMKHGCISVDEETMRKGLRQAIWLGRFEVVKEDPLVILDGAHNAHGIRALCESLTGFHDPMIIFSVLKDKNFEEMLDILETVSQSIIICPFANERAVDIHAIHKRKAITFMEDYREALQEAQRQNRTAIVTGSLYFISDVRSYLMGEAYE